MSTVSVSNSVPLMEGQLDGQNLAESASTAVSNVFDSVIQRTVQIGGTSSTPSDPAAVSPTVLLSGGAIAGIVIGVVAFAVVIGVILYIAFFKQNGNKKNELAPEPTGDIESSGNSEGVESQDHSHPEQHAAPSHVVAVTEVSENVVA